MTLTLTPDQRSEITSRMKPGFTMIARITREQFDGTNPNSAGQFAIEFGLVPDAAIPAIRQIIKTTKT